MGGEAEVGEHGGGGDGGAEGAGAVIEPVLSDEAFLADVKVAPESTPLLHLWWLGQSGYLLNYRQSWSLLDPYLSDSLTLKYAHTDKPHVRMTKRVIDPVALARTVGRFHIVTSSHAHTDHLDAATLRPIVSYARVLWLVTPEANINLMVERSGALSAEPIPQLLGMDDGVTTDVGPLLVE